MSVPPSRTERPTSKADASSAAGESFEEFFRDVHRGLFRALYLVTGQVSEAEDLMQEAFLRVWERWDRFGPQDDRTGYLYRTAMNAFRSRYRRAVRALRRAAAALPARDDFAASYARDVVVQELRRLAPRQRAALVLTELLDYTAQEAGSVLGVKPVTVRVLASQGRAALRRRLEKDDG